MTVMLSLSLFQEPGAAGRLQRAGPEQSGLDCTEPDRSGPERAADFQETKPVSGTMAAVGKLTIQFLKELKTRRQHWEFLLLSRICRTFWEKHKFRRSSSASNQTGFNPRRDLTAC